MPTNMVLVQASDLGEKPQPRILPQAAPKSQTGGMQPPAAVDMVQMPGTVHAGQKPVRGKTRVQELTRAQCSIGTVRDPQGHKATRGQATVRSKVTMKAQMSQKTSAAVDVTASNTPSSNGCSSRRLTRSTGGDKPVAAAGGASCVLPVASNLYPTKTLLVET